MKKILKIGILFSLIITLTGCMKINMNIEISEDLKMKGTVEMLMQESMLATLGTSKEEMMSSMKEQILSEEEDVQIEELEKTIDGESWVGISVIGSDMYDIDGEDVLEKNGDIITMTLPLNELSDEFDEEDDMGYSLEDLKNYGLEMNMNIKMPGKVTSNVGTVNGDTVEIDLLELMIEKNVTNIEIQADMSQSASSNSMMLYVGIAAAVIVVVIAVIIVLKKRKKKDDDNGEIHQIRFCPHCGYRLNGEMICPQCHQKVQ